MTRYVLRILAAMLVVAATVLPASSATAQPQRLRVVATFSIVGELVQNVGGNRIQLTTLVGPDGDTERYEPTAAVCDAPGRISSRVIGHFSSG